MSFWKSLRKADTLGSWQHNCLMQPVWKVRIPDSNTFFKVFFLRYLALAQTLCVFTPFGQSHQINAHSHVYIYIYIYMHSMYTHICLSWIHFCKHIYIYIYTYTYIHEFSYLMISLSLYIYIYIYIDIFLFPQLIAYCLLPLA